MTEQKKVTQKLRDLRIRSGMTVRDLAKALGYKSPGSYAYYEDTDKFIGKYLPVEFLLSLENCIVGKGKPPILRQEVLALSGIFDLGLSEPGKNYAGITEVSKSIPFYDWQITDQDGVFFLPAAPDDYRERPPLLTESPTAYILTMPDASMSPRYLEREALHVNPSAPLQAGQYCVARLAGGKAAIGQLVRRSAAEIVLLRLSPRAELRLPKRNVTALHAIVGTG